MEGLERSQIKHQAKAETQQGYFAAIRDVVSPLFQLQNSNFYRMRQIIQHFTDDDLYKFNMC